MKENPAENEPLELVDYSLEELDQLKNENYTNISKESDLDNAKERLILDKNFK
jgi:hypothetical protein